MLGSAHSVVVQVRPDPDLRQAVEDRAEAEHTTTTTSEIIRATLRHFLICRLTGPTAQHRPIAKASAAPGTRM